MAVKIDINPGLKDLPVMALSSIKEFQEELKDLTELNYNKLKKSLLEQGLLLPFFVWVSPDDGVAYLMDGHQRRRVFIAGGARGSALEGIENIFESEKIGYLLY